ncbi:ABC transporter ATP-binding protein [Bacteroidota bacterium]
MANVKLVNVTKIYEGKNVAVKNVDLEIYDKEFVVIVGPSGCGKSTILRMIAGLEEITEGELYIDGRMVNEVPPKDRDIAMVFQNYALYPHMTVYENMAFGLKMRKMDKKEIQDQVNKAAKILEIEDLLDRKPKALSGGQRQRVAVGRALVRDPKVFLFDEPLSNLDAKLRVQMRTEISKIHNKLETTMVYVTHDQAEAMTMGSRIVIIKDGVIHQIDTPLNVYNLPVNKFVAGFIGSPPMNFISGKILSEGKLVFVPADQSFKLQLEDQYISKLSGYVGKEITLGIKPEDIRIGNSSDNTIAVNVDVVEPMGNEIFIYFTINNIQIISRISPDHQVKANDVVELKFNNNKLFFFDFTTNETIV